MPCSFQQSHQMDINFEVAGPSSPANLLAGIDTISLEKQVGLDTDFIVGGLAEPVSVLSPDKQIDEEKSTEGERYEDEVQNISKEGIQSCGISQEDLSESLQWEVGHIVPFGPFDDSHEVAEQQNSGASLELIIDDQSNQEECTLHNNKSSVHKETVREQMEEYNGDNHTNQDLGLIEYTSMEGQQFNMIPISSLYIDLSPWFHDASTATPEQGL